MTTRSRPRVARQAAGNLEDRGDTGPPRRTGHQLAPMEAAYGPQLLNRCPPSVRSAYGGAVEPAASGTGRFAWRSSGAGTFLTFGRPTTGFRNSKGGAHAWA